MQKSRIEWTDYVWNPIKGLCPVGCWYCYGRRLYRRFGMNPKLRLSRREVFTDFPAKSGAKIFVCSTMELFHPRVMPGWRATIFSRIAMNPQHTFIILTKMPERIDRPMPDNVWLGVSVTGNSTADIVRTEKLAQVKARIKFISFEPLLAEPWLVSLPLRPDWIIAGRLTGHGKIHDPKLSTIEAIVEYGQVKNIAIFLKDNLRDIWPDRLIQEFPR